MFTVNTEIQKHLLKYAASKENLDRMAQQMNGGSVVEGVAANSQGTADVQMEDQTQPQNDEQSIINQIPIAKFKTNHIGMMQGKLAKLPLDQMAEQIEEFKNEDGNIGRLGEMIRLPNTTSSN